jgi:hypothetical protein
MDNVARLKQARSTVVKAQRRIWLAQLAFWPALVLSFVLIAVVGVRWLQRRQRAVTASTASIRPPADDTQAS